jgi:uncharacterized protein DUF3999
MKVGLHRAAPRRATSVALLAAVASLGATPLPTAWRNWHYSRSIELPPADTARLASVTVPEDVFRESTAPLPDLRVIDDAGAEIPYVVRTREGSTSTVSIPAKLIEKSFAPGSYTQVVVDEGAKTPFHNALEIQTSEPDFIEWVSVEASDDAHVWRIVQARAPLFRFQQQSLTGTQTISYSENNARYLRIRILDPAKQFPVAGINVLYKTATPPERVPVNASFTPGTSPSAGRSAWAYDFSFVGVPISSVEFDVAMPAEFIRSVQIFGSSDGREWQPFAQGEIYRYRQGEAAQQQMNLTIPYGGAQSRYWKVEIVNGNDAPLEGVALHLYATPRHVFFEQQPGRNYRLLYGQVRARAPQYDLERRLNTKQEEAAVGGQVGPEEMNSQYSDPRPWSEKNGYVLWIVMGAAILLLGYSAIRSLRKMGPAPPNA